MPPPFGYVGPWAETPCTSGDFPHTPTFHGPAFEPIRKVPHCCPVCNGRGRVPGDFYHITSGETFSTSNIVTSVVCKACDGAGILWS